VQTITVIVGGIAGAGRLSKCSQWGSHAPSWLAGRICKATAIAVPRYKTLIARTTTRSP